MTNPRRFDVIVIGGGHAGCEAALAATRRGARTLLLTPNLDRIGFMPCNPSIGGPAKGHLVAEIDALGGAMGRVADMAALQLRLLNTGKGPAVQALRAQCDKTLYALLMKDMLENAPNLTLIQDEAAALEISDGRRGATVSGVRTRSSGAVMAAAVVVTAGTFLRGRLVRGEESLAGGRAGERADTSLAAELARAGIRMRRFKTGTPPRIDARTVDFSLGTRQPGDTAPRWFSHAGRYGRIQPVTLPPTAVLAQHLRPETVTPARPQLDCLRLDTNPDTHHLIRDNLHRAPMFNGAIEGVGPRYCPSIEDKVHRFGDKDSHPVFLEPEGWRTTEIYVQGLSTSLPASVQDSVLRSIPALRDVHVTRYGYAVEYDAVDANELTARLETRQLPGLFMAGQVNGTSGYEEAAAQGLVAGANAAARALDLPALTLRRDQAYIGVLIDDLTNRPFDEPYRMLTSRAEHRLLLRIDTAPDRLTDIGEAAGLLSERHVREVRTEQIAEQSVVRRLKSVWFDQTPSTDERLSRHSVGRSTGHQNAWDLLRRPDVSLEQIEAVLAESGEPPFDEVSPFSRERIANAATYQGFVRRAEREAGRLSDLDRRVIDARTDYAAIPGLRIEARQRLSVNRPETIGQASRMAGVTPSDVAVLLVHHRRAT